MTTTQEMNAAIAQIIRNQIGSDVWLAVSARDPRWWTNDKGEVVYAFRFGSRYGLPMWCEITYVRVFDYYDVTAYKIHRNGCKKTLSIPDEVCGREWVDFKGVYCDRLAGIVRRANLIGEIA